MTISIPYKLKTPIKRKNISLSKDFHRRQRTEIKVGPLAYCAALFATFSALYTWKLKKQQTKTDTPDYLRCPITQELMTDPVVVCATGQTYERHDLDRWFSLHHPPSDPITNVILPDTSVVPNWALREALNSWHNEQGTAGLPPPAVQPVLPPGACADRSFRVPMVLSTVILVSGALGRCCAVALASFLSWKQVDTLYHLYNISLSM
mmetsp:Transcript_35896/g.49817  ORF Transcript_35896/g.49817 Transcript_35896/m.49817 type:complete len:207 (+) Transcript_35896:120-740(+)|eukprot:CAMPEP_0196587698 /NCGR_PEP_ID=MMETSP1081-20130531/58333_1 /TAXON_ID=36882 /ORGANISM="Pyramimonas amylifera, Strain CCMP720" /LENGTH=206 /DNA_ID=CAMNT_0041909955 /DNA_START=118 /DNA_END=738 /DNA_ORIENTATION=-